MKNLFFSANTLYSHAVLLFEEHGGEGRLWNVRGIRD